MKIGSWPAGAAYGSVANTDLFNVNNSYALLQHSTGHTYLNAAANKNLYFRIANGNAMIINFDKKVGIGTTNPTDRLSVHDATHPALKLSGAGYSAQFAVATSNGFYSPVATAGDAVLRSLSGDLILSSTSQGIRFTTQNNGAASEKMTLTVAGDLGIGTTNPGAKLDVDGEIRTSKAVKFGGGSTPAITNSGNDLVFDGSAIFVGRQDLVKMNFLNQQVNMGLDQSYTPGYVLTVDGKVLVEELKVQNSSNWPDYVFESDYNLADLDEVEAYVKENKHLPEVPAASELSDGVDVGEMQKTLLKKVEELTLYMIEMNKTVEEQASQIQSLEKRNAELESGEAK